MKTNTPIKVIKRSERDRSQQSAEEAATPKNTQKNTQELAREVVANVSQWVNEFQHKRRTETARAFKSLFSDASPQASKA